MYGIYTFLFRHMPKQYDLLPPKIGLIPVVKQIIIMIQTNQFFKQIADYTYLELTFDGIQELHESFTVFFIINVN